MALPLLVVLLWTVVYPNIAVISGSLGHWREFADSPSDVEALINSLVIAVASVGAALVVGVDAAMGAKIMPGGHGVELIDGELVRALQNVQAGYIR